MALNSVLPFTINNPHIESRHPPYAIIKENKSVSSRMESLEDRATQFSFYLAGVLEIHTSACNKMNHKHYCLFYGLFTSQWFREIQTGVISLTEYKGSAVHL